MDQTRKLKTGALHRSATFARETINEDERTVQLAFSSEQPYPRWFGVEILDHDPASVRMERLLDGAPLLLDHDSTRHIGTIEKAEIGADRVGRAVVRFGRSAAAEEAFKDVLDGIRKHISVGYRVHKMRLEETDEEGKVETYRVIDWEPLEVSLVAVPADPTVGIGRGAADEFEVEIEGQRQAQPEQPKPQPLKEKSMDKTAEEIQVIEQRARSDAAKAERDRTAAIIALGEAHAKRGGDKLAVQYVREGKSVEDFRAALLDLAAKDPQPTVDVELSKKEQAQYSYARAIAMATARAEGTSMSGLEAEIHQDLERKLGSAYQSRGGILVPMSLQRAAISEALYNTSGKGSSTVFTQPGDFIELLRAQSVAVMLGARVMNGLTGPVSFPKQTGAATAYWMPENDGTNVTASNAALGSASLTPKTLQATTAYSRQLAAQASLDVEAFIRNDLAAVHALAWDAATLHGTGNNNQPTGIYAASDVNSVAMGGTPTFGKLVDMVTEVAKDNALMGTLAFVTTPGMAGKLAQTVVAASTDTRMIWGGSLTEGNVAGYRAVASNQVSATLGGGSEHGVIFGNWSEVMIGTWGVMELVVDPYALKKQGMVEVTSFQLCDIALRHGQSFCKATGATI